MGQLDARLGRRSSSIGVLSKIPTVPPSEGDGTFNRRESDRLSSSRSATAVFKGEIRSVVLVESDQYYREVLTFELLCQGFVVHAFADGASLLGSLASVIDADLAVLDWDLPNMPGIKLMAQLREHGINLPVVFPDRQVHGRQRARAMPSRPAGNSECLRMHGLRPRRRRLHRQVA
jgi:CheY-like chemotaxis protein